MLSLYSLWKITKGQKDQNKDILKVVIPLLIPLFALLIPIFFPKTTQIIVPELEKKLEENKKLKQEVQDLNAIITDKEKLQKKSDERIKELSDKNYAEIAQASLVIDGLEKAGSKGSIAVINDSTYYGETILKDALNKKVNYVSDEKVVYLGDGNQKITKAALSESYSMLYSGERFISLEDYDKEVKVAGKSIENGFILENSKYNEKGAFVLINTSGAYNSVEFDVGKLDSKNNYIDDGKLKIDLDGVRKQQENVSAEIATTHYKFDINGAKTLKISILESGSEFGFYNVVFNK